MRTGVHLSPPAGAVLTMAAVLNNDTLRIALIAVVAVAAAKFVLPRVPGGAGIAAFL
jgi:hypothetical protein